MADDIVTQLQRLSTTLERGEGRSTVLGAAAEIERLRRWQSEATTVIENWEAVFDALIDPKPADLGVSKSVLVAKEIILLRAAGDALADSYNSVWIGIANFDQLFIDKWKEARRG